MPRTLEKSRLYSSELKLTTQQKPYNIKSYLPPNIQSFKQKLLSVNGFLVYESA